MIFTWDHLAIVLAGTAMVLVFWGATENGSTRRARQERRARVAARRRGRRLQDR